MYMFSFFLLIFKLVSAVKPCYNQVSILNVMFLPNECDVLLLLIFK